MTIPHYDTLRDQPLTTDDDIAERIEQLLEGGLVLRLWFMFLDDEGVQLPLLLPMDVVDSPGDADAEAIALALSDLTDAAEAATVIIVVEWGERDPQDRVAEWMHVARAASQASGRPFRGPFDCSPTGVSVCA